MKKVLLAILILFAAELLVNALQSLPREHGPADAAVREVHRRLDVSQARRHAEVNKLMAAGRIRAGKQEDDAFRRRWLVDRNWVFAPLYSYQHEGVKSWNVPQATRKNSDIAAAYRNHWR